MKRKIFVGVEGNLRSVEVEMWSYLAHAESPMVYVVCFKLDGKTYEIDLPPAELLDQLKRGFP